MGECRLSDSMTSLATDGGAEAESAMKGTSAKALNPPMLLNDVLKSAPLNMHTLTNTSEQVRYSKPFWNAVCLVYCY